MPADLSTPATSVAGTGADVIVAAFARHGVEVVFGQSIPTRFHLAAPARGLRQCAYRAENAGGAMADGYARASGRVGVVTAQNGPAAALLVAPLAEAMKASSAVVALVQDVDRDVADRNAFQELDHGALFAPVCKWVRRIDDASRIDDYVDMAFSAAAGGRPGPAVLLVTDRLLQATARPSSHRCANLGAVPLDRTAPDPARVARAAQRLATARDPLVIAGGGVHTSGGCEALAALQSQFSLPVATTAMGKGAVDERHPLSVGVIGNIMGEGSRTGDLFELVRRADVVLLVGTRTNRDGTNAWRLLSRDASCIHLDIDPAEIGRNYESLRLAGDAKLGLEALAEALSRLDPAPRQARRRDIEKEIATAHARADAWLARVGSRADRGLRPERLMLELDRRLGPDDMAVADASYASTWMSAFLTSKKPGARFLAPRGLAGLGWGLPMAIGAAVAAPARRVVCVTGDGGFAHAWAEIETAVRLALKLPIVVLNNQVLAYQRDAENTFFGAHTDACYLGAVDHAAIGIACGARGVTVENADEYTCALDEALEYGGPTVIDVKVDDEARPPLSFYRNRFPAPPGAAVDHQVSP